MRLAGSRVKVWKEAEMACKRRVPQCKSLVTSHLCKHIVWCVHMCLSHHALAASPKRQAEAAASLSRLFHLKAAITRHAHCCISKSLIWVTAALIEPLLMAK